MMSKKKGILNAVFLITVFAITIYAIFHGQDLGELFGYIRNTDYRYWLVAVVCVVFFQLYYTIGNRRTAGTDLLYEKG